MKKEKKLYVGSYGHINCDILGTVAAFSLEGWGRAMINETNRPSNLVIYGPTLQTETSIRNKLTKKQEIEFDKYMAGDSIDSGFVF